MDIKEKGYTGADNPNHVYPIFDRMMSRADKEELLHQKGLMVDRKSVV